MTLCEGGYVMSISMCMCMWPHKNYENADINTAITVFITLTCPGGRAHLLYNSYRAT